MKTPSDSDALSYGAGFYGEIAGGSFRSAGIVLPLLFDLIHPTSVVDVGCGVGTWLRAAQELGATEILGIDGGHVPRHLLEIEVGHFRSQNLERPLEPVGRRFDLALSLEVAEHLSRQRADSFVADLCALADVVLFSAAIPGQGGQEHINEQWQSEWAERFANNGYMAIDMVRPVVWTNPAVEYWYQQNAIVYIATSRPELAGLIPALFTPPVLDIVHPTTWTRTSDSLQRQISSQPGVRLALRQTVGAVRNLVSARLVRCRRPND